MKVDRKKQIFETMVKPTCEETYKYLTGYRAPRTAFILFEKQEFKVVGDGDYDYGTGLFTLNVEHRPEQISKINQYLGKGYKIIHYANFPGVHRKDSASVAQARLYSQGEAKKNPWEELEAYVQSCISNNPHWRSELAEKDELLAAAQAKNAEMERRLAEMEKKLKGGKDKADAKDKAPEVQA